MDALRRMRQRDWARVFGMACAFGGVALSGFGHAGADWDGLILLLGSLMLLRGAVEGPMTSRVAGLMRAVRLILLMLAFGAVNRAQGGVEGAVAGVLTNPILWAVAALLLALPLLRRGLPWRAGEAVGAELVYFVILVIFAWILSDWLETGGDLIGLRWLVVVAALVNGLSVLRAGPWSGAAGVAIWVTAVCVVVPPGGVIWPAALGLGALFSTGLTLRWLAAARRE